MSENTPNMPTICDVHDEVRITRTFHVGQETTKIILREASSEKYVGSETEGPIHALSIRFEPPLSDTEQARVLGQIPGLTGINGLEVREGVDCYDYNNMINWKETQITRPAEAGPWTSEGAQGLLNATSMALTHQVVLPIEEGRGLPE